MKLYFSWRIHFDYAFCAAFALAFYVFSGVNLGFEWPDKQEMVSLMLAVMGAAASLLGFVLAASTFMIGHVQSERLELLRRSQSWEEFPKLVRSCLWRLLTLTIVSGAYALLSPDAFRSMAPLMIFLLSLAIMALAALMWISLAIISIPQR